MLGKKKFMFPGANLNLDQAEEEKVSGSGEAQAEKKPTENSNASSANGEITEKNAGSANESTGEKKLSKLEELKRKKEQAMNRIESKIKSSDSNVSEGEKPPAVKEEKLSAAELAKKKREELLKSKGSAGGATAANVPTTNATTASSTSTEGDGAKQPAAASSGTNNSTDLDATQKKLAELKMKYKNDGAEVDASHGARVFPKTTTNFSSLQKKFMFPTIKEEEREGKNSQAAASENKGNEKPPDQESVEKVGMDEFSKRLEALQSNLATKLGALKRESLKIPPPISLPEQNKSEGEVIDSKNYRANMKKKLLIDPEAEENKNSVRPHTLVTPSGKKINAKLAAIVAKLEETMGGEKWDPDTGKVISQDDRRRSLGKPIMVPGSSWTFEHLTLERPSGPAKYVKDKKRGSFFNEV